MDNRTKWISSRIRTGWTFLWAGFLVGAIGYSLNSNTGLPYNYRIITAGHSSGGIGVGFLVRYTAALKNEIICQAYDRGGKDERVVLIRARAGNEPLGIHLLVYIGLMWHPLLLTEACLRSPGMPCGISCSGRVIPFRGVYHQRHG
jgi:hypothetical protein